MDSELLRALCALASFALPLAVAWLIVGRDARKARKARLARETSVPAAAEAQEPPARCYPLRCDL